jgi:hypothetical protein
MNNIINYIIKNYKITNIKDDVIKIIFLYNYRYYKNLHWLNIVWVKFPKSIENYLIECYINENIYDMKKYNHIIKHYSKDIRKTILELNNNTFIKFLYDNNYLNENILILLSEVNKINYNIYGNVTIYEHLIDQNDFKNINLLENNNYINLGNFIDKNISPFGIYYKELIRINKKNWIVLTGYKELIFEEKENIKILCWIFSKEI